MVCGVPTSCSLVAISLCMTGKDGCQSQKNARDTCRARCVRTSEPVAEAVVIDGRKRVVKSQVPEVQNRHSSGVAWKACTGLLHKERKKPAVQFEEQEEDADAGR